MIPKSITLKNETKRAYFTFNEFKKIENKSILLFMRVNEY